MARIQVTVESVVVGGLNPTYTAANADGHKAAWSRRLFAYIKQGTGARQVTIQTAATVDGLAVADRTVTVPENGERAIFLGKPSYVQADGMVYIDYDATTNTTIALMEVPE